MLEYQVVATRLDAHGSVAKAKQAEVPLDTDLAGRADALIQPNFSRRSPSTRSNSRMLWVTSVAPVARA